jgi:hypothetical protein
LRAPVCDSDEATSGSIATLSSRRARAEGQDFIDRRVAVAPVDQPVGRRDRTCVDQRIARDAPFAFKLDDRVERAARWFAPDAVPERTAKAAERESQREDFRDRLDRKAMSLSPAVWTVPSGRASAKPKWLGSTLASAGI